MVAITSSPEQFKKIRLLLIAKICAGDEVVMTIFSVHNMKTTILVIIFWNFRLCWHRFDSPQVKRNLISSMANLVYELSHTLPNDLRLRILGN